jgi:hypothetical protein
MRARQVENITQEMNQQQTRLDFLMVVDTIDVDNDSLFH